ncbi:MAG: hypothetical protein IJ087_21605 [Eggerthellaceae bacterium]|nr:hypothetical protein [Eggerthellaceae bacterium]
MGSFQREERRRAGGRVHAPGAEITMPSAGGSILYGMGPDGNLHHINDVERGEACNCVCPDPNCGQTLIARKGEKKSHHFAHKRGTCEWAAEYVISAVAADIVQRAGAIVFPKLTFKDSFTGSDETIAQGQSVRISSVRLVQESGRGNPDLLITRKASSGEVREFLVLFSLVHGVTRKQREAVRQTGRDSFVVDLNYLMRLRKEDLGKHFDREQILLGFQDPQFLSRILTQGEGRCMRWLFNARRSEAEAENRARHNEWLAEQEAKHKAAEEARRKREEEMRREAERRRRENGSRARTPGCGGRAYCRGRGTGQKSCAGSGARADISQARPAGKPGRGLARKSVDTLRAMRQGIDHRRFHDVRRRWSHQSRTMLRLRQKAAMIRRAPPT